MEDLQKYKEADEVVITTDNYKNYFTDVRTGKPQPGQVIACYSAMADFAKGPEKRQIIDLLGMEGKAEAIVQIVRKLLFASEVDSIRLPLQMAKDLADGMSPKQVERKLYRYKIEMFYYTWEEYVPVDDPHWTIIKILNSDEKSE
jgi:hypothetical protein